MTAGTPDLDLAGVSKCFGAHVAVDAVDLSIDAGGVHGLIGPNGSGKTTLLNIVSGAVRCDSGRVSYGGQDITAAPAHRVARAGIARTFQNLRIFKRLSVYDNVCAGLRGNGPAGGLLGDLWPRHQRRDEVAPILLFVGLLDRADDIAQDLPLGAQRRLELARALACRPTLLLLDEPAGGMTPGETDQMAELVTDIAQQGVTIVMVEHKMKLVMGVCRRVAVLHQGRLIADGTPEEVQAAPLVVEAYMGTRGRHA